MRVLWICSLPLAVQKTVLEDEEHGAQVAMSWILAHFPPPDGIDLHIACLWPGGSHRKRVEFQGIPFHLLPCPARGRALLFFQRDVSFFRALFDELKPDVIHGWGTEDSFGLVARRLSPLRHVIGIQGLITEYRRRIPQERRTIITGFTERLTLRSARWVVAESEYSRRIAQPLCPRAEMRVVEHPLRREFLDAEPSDGRECRAVFIGRIDERKGISDAIAAFSQAAPDTWTLQVIGSGTPENEMAMARLAGEVGMGARLVHDRSLSTPEIVAAMRRSSIFLLPSRIDTGPTALKESLAMGLWPVCYDNSGPGEYIRKFRFGSLARDLDPIDLTATLRTAIEERPWADLAVRNELLAASRKIFSREEIWPQLQGLYSDIVAAAGGRR